MDSELIKTLQKILKEINNLHSAQLFQSICNGVTRTYFADKIAKLQGSDREVLMAELERWTKIAYDKELLELENVSSSAAASLDVRGTIPETSDQDWILPQEPEDKSDS